MSNKQESQKPAERREEEGGLIEAVVAEGVMGGLGRPGFPHHVLTRRVWGDNYRVNVYVGDPGSFKVAHSYFLTADSNGKILTSSPAITRVYPAHEKPLSPAPPECSPLAS